MTNTISRVKRFLLLSIWLVRVHATCCQAAENMIAKAKANKVTSGKLVSNSKGVRFRYKNGTYAKNTWLYYKSKVYSFKADGYANKGFFTYGDGRYYADKKGSVYYKKWVTKNGKRYYLKSNGRKAVNETLKLNGKTYKFNASGLVVKADPVLKAKYVFVGDSRVVGMKSAVGGTTSAYIGKIGEGYSYLSGTVDKTLREYLKQKPKLKVVFCFGINDLGNVDQYISYYKSIVKDYPDATFYFMSVNPISSWRNTASLSNTKIKAFNKKLKNAFGAKYINTYSYLVKKGFNTFDGVHYTAATYKKLYNYVISKIK